MSTEKIQNALSAASAHLQAHPEDAVGEDKPARAVLQAGLRISVHGPNAWEVTTDMPAGLGGEASAPSPGWLRRAAQASCEATMIAMRAAQENVELDHLKVVIGSRSDDRGMLGLAAEAAPGPSESWAEVSVSAKGVSHETLRRIVDWAEAHSPVTDSLCRAVPHTLKINIA